MDNDDNEKNVKAKRVGVDKDDDEYEDDGDEDDGDEDDDEDEDNGDKKMPSKHGENLMKRGLRGKTLHSMRTEEGNSIY